MSSYLKTQSVQYAIEDPTALVGDPDTWFGSILSEPTQVSSKTRSISSKRPLARTAVSASRLSPVRMMVSPFTHE